MRSAAATGTWQSNPEGGGPGEVVALADGFAALIDAFDREHLAGSRLAALVESSHDAIIGMTLHGVITSWNIGATEMYGYRASEMVGAPYAALVPVDCVPDFQDALAAVARGTLLDPRETVRRCEDGTLLDVAVRVSPVMGNAGQIVGASVVARDITVHKRDVEALRASEARKSAVLHSALDCVITMDHAGRIVEFNPAAERTFGYTAAEAYGRALAELIIPPAFRAAHAAGLTRYLLSGEGPILGERLELTAIRADGSEFPVELTVTRVDMTGPPLFTGYLRDLTDRIRADEERESLEHRLNQSQRLESLGQLAGGIAHDFNNLLAVILGYAGFVAEHPGIDDEVRGDVERIQRAGQRAVDLTHQLLIFGRRDTVEPAVLDLNAIVADVQELLARSIGADVRLVVDTAPDRPAVRIDRGQLEQVLLNL
ncbi:MAG: PAS domain S-box protein, partial [Actinomycetota bacterium]|nr:PAS domain S-box protein [Actinomycetota bacterium]